MPLPEAHAVTARAAESRDEASRSLENQPRHNKAAVVSRCVQVSWPCAWPFPDTFPSRQTTGRPVIARVSRTPTCTVQEEGEMGDLGAPRVQSTQLLEPVHTGILSRRVDCLLCIAASGCFD